MLIDRSVRTLTAEDPGYFGPRSASWRIFSHASYGASGIAAVLMQALDPVAMALVDRSSMFRIDAWRRAHLTANYVFTITFSSRAIADEAAATVRSIHTRIRGADSRTGEFRRADDPELLLWVHAVHTECALRGYEMFVRRLPPDQADRFVAEQVIAAELVGLARAVVPATRAELRRYLDNVPDRKLTEPATEFARMLLNARMPVTMRFFWALHVAAAAMLLPEEIRRSYSFPRWLPRGRLSRIAISVALRAMNAGYLLFQPVRQARARMRSIERVLA